MRTKAQGGHLLLNHLGNAIHVLEWGVWGRRKEKEEGCGIGQKE
jgi:hypothetical protein